MKDTRSLPSIRREAFVELCRTDYAKMAVAPCHLCGLFACGGESAMPFAGVLSVERVDAMC